jgi:predicted dithiol-disulfide oxidoreductase (DUF899 family)
MSTGTFTTPRIVSRNEWLAPRTRLLVMEKDATRARDALAAKRRDLPWVKVEKPTFLTARAAVQRYASAASTPDQLGSKALVGSV